MSSILYKAGVFSPCEGLLFYPHFIPPKAQVLRITIYSYHHTGSKSQSWDWHPSFLPLTPFHCRGREEARPPRDAIPATVGRLGAPWGTTELGKQSAPTPHPRWGPRAGRHAGSGLDAEGQTAQRRLRAELREHARCERKSRQPAWECFCYIWKWRRCLGPAGMQTCCPITYTKVGALPTLNEGTCGV